MPLLHTESPGGAPASAAVPCKSCQSVSAGDGFVSFGAASFVTSTRLPEPALYSVLRQQCVRCGRPAYSICVCACALTHTQVTVVRAHSRHRVWPGALLRRRVTLRLIRSARSLEFVFARAPDNRVATLSYVFHVVDGEARGSSRQYSLCCVSLAGASGTPAAVFAQASHVHRRGRCRVHPLQGHCRRV